MKQFKEHVRNSVNIGCNDYSTNIKGGFFMKKTVSIILIGIILIGMLGVNTEKVKAANGFPDYIYEGSYGQVKTNLKVRSKPTTNSDQIGLLYTDQWIYISGQVYSSDGYQWAYSSTVSGYVAIDYLKNIYYASANKYDLALNYEVGDAYEFSSGDIGREIYIRFMFKGDKIHALHWLCDKRISFKWGEIIWAPAGEWCQGVVYITPQEAKDFTFSIEMLDDNWKSMKEFSLNFKYMAESSKNSKMMEYLNNAPGSSAVEWGGGSGTQCVELPKHYIDMVFGCDSHYLGLGNGNTLYSGIANQFPDKFTAIRYYDGFKPKVGDLISLVGSQKQYGHAAIVTKVEGDKYWIIEQWKGSGTINSRELTITGSTSSKNGIIGVARPK